MPKSNSEYWIKKLNRNRERDEQVNLQLREQGWTVLRFWEFEVKRNTNNVISQILGHLGK